MIVGEAEMVLLAEIEGAAELDGDNDKISSDKHDTELAKFWQLKLQDPC